MSKQVGIGLVGYGYWGPNLARNFATNPATKLVSICELSDERRLAAERALPGTHTTDSFEELLNNEEIVAIAIATPTASHYPLAKASLLAGKHAFVEKPLTDSSATADELVELAATSGLILHVDHTFIYTAAVEFLANSISGGELGDLLYFDSSRVNLGLFQPDVNVLWDLAVHDLSILQFITKRTPVAVSATGVFHPQSSQASAAFMTVSYDDHFAAHIDVSWMSPVKLRRTLISGTSKMLIYDDLEQIEKIKIFDAGIDFPNSVDEIRNILVSYRTGDMVSPRLRETEALAAEVTHFAECVTSGNSSKTDGVLGATLVRILEAATTSLNNGGAPIQISH